MYFRDLSPELLKFKQSLINADENWLWGGVMPVPVAVREAIKDYGQGAHRRYPVFPRDTQEPAPPPYTGEINVPHAWCSEFASWALREETPLLENPADPDAPIIPIASSSGKDIGVGGGYEWLSSEDWLDVDPASQRVGFRHFGDDLGIDNGPTAQQWSDLGTEIYPGDYVARNQFDTANNKWRRHSMIFIGWVDQLGTWTHIGPAYFNPDRRWNYMLQVSGNYWRKGSPVAIVGLDVVTVCKDPDYIYLPAGGGLVPVDPLNLPAGVECDLRLWDTHEQNNDKEGGFFGLIH